jgi:UDP-N-acetylmuramyl pentapeptide synthase
MVFLIGAETLPALAFRPGGAETREWVYAETMEELSAALGEVLAPGDLVLLKGSRALALERLMDVIRAAEKTEAPA